MNTQRPVSAITRGRDHLAAWLDAQPRNFYLDDPFFRGLVHRHADGAWDASMEERLTAFGALCATELDAAAAISNCPWNLPRLERYDGIGRRNESIEVHPSYHDCGRIIYESGMMGEYARPGGFLRSLAFFHLSSMCGEAGHNCPVACTAGIIRSLQALGTDELKQRFLPGLYADVYRERLDGAQFLTEVQGGSDVGANGTRAHRDPDGTWRIVGEKWFCSNANADLILMTARYADDVDGTRGLGLFLVPRFLDTGEANGFRLRRLKDKLGTRSMPSAEIDFEGAFAWCLGEVEDGFKNMMTHVINTSRVYNAIAVGGAARRAAFVASTYARHRHAFGQPVADYPLAQELMAFVNAESAGILASSFDLVALSDRVDQRSATAEELGYFRFAVNVNKMRTSRSAVEITLTGIELLGGNGAIESFSPMPRLHRDMIVCENWEGTHNTLTAQVVRDMARFEVHRPWVATMQRRWSAIDTGTLEPLRDHQLAGLETLRTQLEEIVTLDPALAPLRMRRLMDATGFAMYVLGLAEQARFELRESGDERAWNAARWLHNHRCTSWAPALPVDELELLRRVSEGP